MLLALALLMLHDPIERARGAALAVLDRLSKDGGPGASAARESVLTALADVSPEVRDRAVATLIPAGGRVIPQLREQLAAADPTQRRMAAVVLARIEPRKYGSLVLGEALSDCLRTTYANLACLQALAECQGLALDVLDRALRERNGELLKQIFYLLSAVQDQAAVDAIGRSLASPQADTRANAAEALESLTSAQTSALIAPLLEPYCLPPLALARETWGLAIATPAAALRLLLSDGDAAWQRTLAAAALSELSAYQDLPESDELAELHELARADPDPGVRAEVTPREKTHRLSLVGKTATLKGLPFFAGLRVEQLRDLAGVCEEQFFLADTRLFEEGEPGGVLYVVVDGLVGIEQERRKGSFARLANVEANGYLGESEFFDNDCRANRAVAVRDTLALKLRREPLIALARQQPDLSLQLISVLGDRLREANERIAELTRTEPERLQLLYGQL
jgi:hypothetical protein